MKKVLVIAGPTATGKTSLALQISDNINSIIISADSRQVYKEMDVVTGKDHPDDINILGTNLVNPDQEFSVTTWLGLAKNWINQSWADNKLPIVVGGTGLYIHALVEGIGTTGIRPDHALRDRVSGRSPEELRRLLQKVSPQSLNRMNNSDRSNPRRLVRAIEISNSPQKLKTITTKTNYKIFAITPSLNHINLIKQRVKRRLYKDLAIIETQQLITKYPDTPESFTSIGYKLITRHIAGEISRTELIDNWTKQEYSYAKKQLRWFKKMKQVIWLNSKQINQVVKNTKTWYHENK